jgi:hypothetical protein
MWRRAEAASTNGALFTKIALTKLLVLSDQKSREDYFVQQAEFVTQHGRGDEFVEFSTDIQGKNVFVIFLLRDEHIMRILLYLLWKL